jgi:hypothetical protein
MSLKNEKGLNKKENDKKLIDENRKDFNTEEHIELENTVTYSDIIRTTDTVFEKVSKTAVKAYKILKTGAEKASNISESAIRLTKLKYEAGKLKNEQDKLFLEAGKKVWNLHKLDKLSQVESDLSDDLLRLIFLQNKITANEKEIEGSSLFEQNNKL